MAFDALTANVKASIGWDVSKDRTGLDPLADSQTEETAIAFTLGTNTAKQVDEIASVIVNVPANGDATLDLGASMTDVLNQLTIALVRVKAIKFNLLSTEQDDTYGTACSGVTVGNSASNPCKLFLSNSTFTFDLTNGDFIAYSTPGASGLTVTNGSADLVKFHNNDAARAGNVKVTVLGSSS